MRVLSIIPSAYVAFGALYIIVGGPFNWRVYCVHAVLVSVSVAVLALTFRHVRKNPSLTTDDKNWWRLRLWHLSIVAVPMYWNGPARR